MQPNCIRTPRTSAPEKSRRRFRPAPSQAIARETVGLTCFASAMLLCTMVGAQPAPGTSQRTERVVQALEQYNALADMHLPMPSPGQVGDIVAGEVVKLRRRMAIHSPATNTSDHRIRVAGYRLIERPRLLVWLAALDVGTEHSDRLIEHVLSADENGGSVWYQHLRLGWPLRNRHWTIENRKSVELTDASQGMIWEHAWQLAAGGDTIASRLLAGNEIEALTGDKPLRAIYLPANRGAWTMFELDDGLTLVAAHATVELGGIIPDAFVASYVSRQLAKMLDGLVARSDVMDIQYDTSYTIYTGAGEAITRPMAEEAMKTFRKFGNTSAGNSRTNTAGTETPTP